VALNQSPASGNHCGPGELPGHSATVFLIASSETGVKPVLSRNCDARLPLPRGGTSQAACGADREPRSRGGAPRGRVPGVRSCSLPVGEAPSLGRLEVQMVRILEPVRTTTINRSPSRIMALAAGVVVAGGLLLAGCGNSTEHPVSAAASAAASSALVR
jgi:hypothetical protein